MGVPPTPAVEQFTGYLLRRAYVRSVGAARACIPDDAHIREVAILSILAEQGAISQRALGDVTHVNRSLIVKLVDGLETKQWVVRERSPDDRRAYALRLTQEGSEALAELNLDLDRGEADLTGGLGADEVARLKSLLRELLVDDPALAVTTLAERTGYLITHAHHRLRGWAEQVLEPLGLHLRDFGVLLSIAREGPCSQSHLASRLEVSSPAMLGFVGELETRGFVSRSRNTQDRRLLDLTLTAEGRECLALARDGMAGIHALTVSRLGADGDRELRDLLAKLLAS